MPAGFHRRELLHLSGLGIASLGLAPWIERAFAAAESSQDDGRAKKPRPISPRALALADAWAEARMRGKPMLVFVVPAFRDGGERGRILAAFLQEASDHAHAELALCEVACATVAEVRALIREPAKGLKGEPLAVLVEPDGMRARAVVEWIHPLPTSKRYEPTFAEVEERKRWVEEVALELHDAITGDGAVLGRRAEEAIARHPAAVRERLVGLEARRERWSSPDIAACPALALLSARRNEAHRDHIVELSGLSRAALVERSPRGARWGENFGGCGGVRLQDPPEELSSPGPCGTGFLPPQSRRFLWLFTKTDP